MPKPLTESEINELIRLSLHLQACFENAKQAHKHDNIRHTSANLSAAESTVETISTVLEKFHTNHTG